MAKPQATHREPVRVPVPSGLSPWAAGVWNELVDLHDFEAHELICFERALRWWTRSDAAAAQADTASAADGARLVKVAVDCASTALRHWRVLKFPPPAGARRPGRPSGPEWSPQRRAAKGGA